MAMKPMDLEAFLTSNLRNAWIHEKGLNYYVRKCMVRKGTITLVSCSSRGTVPGAFWRFLRRHKGKPFTMEQVINPEMAQYMRRLGWHEEDIEGVPQFISPEAEEVLVAQGWKIMSVAGSVKYVHPASIRFLEEHAG